MLTAWKTGWVACCLAMGLVSVAMAEPDYWDPRLDLFCGLELIDVASQTPPGQGYWRLKEARFENEDESGFNHHIYVKALDVNGQPIIDQKFFKSWPYSNFDINESACVGSNWDCALTKGGGIDDYYGNSAMYANCPPGACNGAYNAFISQTSSPRGYVGQSDKVAGMWMHNPDGTGCGAHVNFRLVFQWTINPVSEPPTISHSPSSFLRTITIGDSLPKDTFTVQNIGGFPLEYTIVESVPWLSVDPASGTSTGETDTITITYDLSSVGLGPHQGVIEIVDADATNSPQNVVVVLTVDPRTAPGDFDSDGDVDQADFGRFQTCFTSPGQAQDDPDCVMAKLDEDADVDQNDFGLFQRCISGPGNPADPDCLTS